MELYPIALDALRLMHLSCFAAGMGTVLFHDFLTFRALRKPISLADIESIKQLHAWIVCAFAGLWITGIALIYVRTAFDITAFSPKLWVKVGLMLLLTVNGSIIRTVVMPVLNRNLGCAMCEIPYRDLVLSSQVAIISMFGWTSGMILGASTYLKTAPWEVLLPLAVIWFAATTLGGQLSVLLVRTWMKAKPDGMTST